eukprot:349951-Chlamydomonas_euryale.AAC.1
MVNAIEHEMQWERARRQQERQQDLPGHLSDRALVGRGAQAGTPAGIEAAAGHGASSTAYAEEDCRVLLAEIELERAAAEHLHAGAAPPATPPPRGVAAAVFKGFDGVAKRKE